MSKNENKGVAVVSGGLGMLGCAVGSRLAEDGFVVALLTLNNPGIDQRKALASFPQSKVFVYRCDLTVGDEVAVVLQKIEAQHGPIEVGVHCAHAPLVRKKVTDVDVETFKVQFGAGVFGGFNFFHTLSALMKPRMHGTLIGVTTIATERDPEGGTFSAEIAAKSALVGGYLSAKFALKGMLQEFRQSLKQYNISVYAVAPGFMPGGLNSDLPPRLFEFMKEKTPSGRLTEAEDVAKVVSSLITDRESVSEFTSIVDETTIGA